MYVLIALIDDCVYRVIDSPQVYTKPVKLMMIPQLLLFLSFELVQYLLICNPYTVFSFSFLFFEMILIYTAAFYNQLCALVVLINQYYG